MVIRIVNFELCESAPIRSKRKVYYFTRDTKFKLSNRLNPRGFDGNIGVNLNCDRVTLIWIIKQDIFDSSLCLGFSIATNKYFFINWVAIL